jgi:hypothetical protein
MSDNVLTPLTVRKTCQHYANLPTPTSYDSRRFGALIGHINAAVKQFDVNGSEITDSNRRLILGFLFTLDNQVMKPLHSDQLTSQQKYAIERWIGAALVDDRWTPRSTFKAEANWILNLSLYFQALLLSNGNKGSMSLLLDGYLIEAGVHEDWVGADYWLKLALELPGELLTHIYQEGAEDDPGMLPYSEETDATPPRDQESEWALEFDEPELDQFVWRGVVNGEQ